MKSRKVKAYARKKAKVDLKIDVSDDSDVNPDSFFHDEIDDFNEKKDNELSTDDELIQGRPESSDEEEVLPITDDEKDDSDDDEREGDGLPNREAWGKKKFIYYSTDFVDQDRGRTYRDEDAAAAKAEEEEALAIQKSVYHNIKTDNLGAHLFFESAEESAEEEETVNKDSATKQEILKYLKKETKIFEYKALFESSVQKHKKLLRLLNLIKAKKIRSKQIEQYVRVKKQILCLIIHNLNMYYMYASTGKIPKNHPVNQRIAQFKQFLDDLESSDHVLSSAIDELLEKESRGEDINISSEPEDEASLTVTQSIPSTSKDTTEISKSMKKANAKHIGTEDEKEIASYISELKAETRKRKLDDNDDDDDNLDDAVDQAMLDQDENNGDEKRVISYQIAKNKGLTPHRKKEYRNPRVRNRNKFRRAEIRRKGQVRGVIKEVKRYAGEPTGINMNVVKSRKFK